MKAMGLRGGINWLAWFISTYAAMLLVSLFVGLILKYGGFFPITDLSIIFMALAVFAFSAIMLRLEKKFTKKMKKKKKF
jgi:hypothetical protein